MLYSIIGIEDLQAIRRAIVLVRWIFTDSQYYMKHGVDHYILVKETT